MTTTANVIRAATGTTPADKLRHAADTARTASADVAQDLREATTTAAADLRERATDAAADLRDRAAGAAQAVADAASTKADAARDALVTAGDTLRDAANRAAPESLQARALNLAATGLHEVANGVNSQTLTNLLGQARDVARRNPTMVVAGAAVVGYALARYLRSSVNAPSNKA